MITSVVSDTTPASRTRETLESALLNSPSPDNNILSEKHAFSVDDDEKTKKSQLPVTYVAEPVDEKKKQSAEDKTTELPVLVESKGTETEEDADAILIEKDTTPEVEPEASEADEVIITNKQSDEEVDDSVIIIIQAAIRGFLVCSCFLSSYVLMLVRMWMKLSLTP